ncbi:MAG: ABC transporter ATP-binding protein [Hymenobacteraceae bacterium]|nr:ABC transporter ATP-binding protein [Hymenobacteraceae bacterium]
MGYASSPEGALLRDLSFVVTAGRLLAVVGHNGAGKSTLVRILTGQLRPLAGRVGVADERQSSPKESPARLPPRSIAWLPQRTDVRTPVPVRALVLMGRYRHKRWFDAWAPTDYARADAALARCGVAHLAGREFTTLSGGEQQLVWLAQLWAQDAPVYILDEPTQQLDVYHRRRVFDLLADWVLTEGRAVIVVTHDLANLAALPPALSAELLNLSPATGSPGVVPLTPATVRAAQAALESGPGLSVS